MKTKQAFKLLSKGEEKWMFKLPLMEVFKMTTLLNVPKKSVKIKE
jgi:hypothetical protein